MTLCFQLAFRNSIKESTLTKYQIKKKIKVSIFNFYFLSFNNVFIANIITQGEHVSAMD